MFVCVCACACACMHMNACPSTCKHICALKLLFPVTGHRTIVDTCSFFFHYLLYIPCLQSAPPVVRVFIWWDNSDLHAWKVVIFNATIFFISYNFPLILVIGACPKKDSLGPRHRSNLSFFLVIKTSHSSQ